MNRRIVCERKLLTCQNSTDSRTHNLCSRQSPSYRMRNNYRRDMDCWWIICGLLPELSDTDQHADNNRNFLHGFYYSELPEQGQ